MNKLELETVVAQLGSLPAIPDVVIELQDIFRQETPDIEQIAHKIGQDQVIVAKVLRLANSSFYGLQCKVASIHDAIVVLGLRTVRTLVTAAGITAHLRSNPLLDGFDQGIFWLHSVGAAFCARRLSLRIDSNLESAENAFITGLLHDIGRYALATLFPAQYRCAIAYRDRHDCQPLDAEHEVIGIDHAQVGAALAQRWKFTPDICKAIALHHCPDDSQKTTLTDVIHLADIMAHALDFPSSKDDLMPLLSEKTWRRIGLDWQEFGRLLAEADAHRHEADQLLD